MTPNINDYRILYEKGSFYVLTPYDLYSAPSLRIIGKGWSTRNAAGEFMDELYKKDIQEYNRLKEMKSERLPDERY